MNNLTKKEQLRQLLKEMAADDEIVCIDGVEFNTLMIMNCKVNDLHISYLKTNNVSIHSVEVEHCIDMFDITSQNALFITDMIGRYVDVSKITTWGKMKEGIINEN